MSEPLLLVYLPYAAIAVTLTVWLAKTLSRHGEVFLHSVFPDRPQLADAINQLLVIGFYLVNLGWALLLLRPGALARTITPTEAVSVLITRLGMLLLLLGVAHMINLYIFHRVRTGAEAKSTATTAT
jgi:hypothetical protein